MSAFYHIHVMNAADITNRVIETGLFQRKKIEKTLSDAINIEVASTIIMRYKPGVDH